MDHVATSKQEPHDVTRMRPSGLFWPMWAIAFSIPWLLPTHSAPWTTFYQELLSAVAALAAGAWVLTRVPKWRLDPLAAGFFVMAALPLLQAAGGLFMLPVEAPLVTLYLVGFAVTLLVARHAEQVAPGRLIEALLAGILIAALASTGLALYQWLGGDSLGILVAPMPFRDRPVANVGQPNNLATLLVWGLVAVWWGYSRQRIGGFGALLAAAFLLVGVTLTQSRAGAIQVILLFAAAVVGRRRLRASNQTLAFAGLALWWVTCLVALGPLTSLWTDQVNRSMVNPDSPRERMMLMRTVLLEIGDHPWTGYGWYQNVPAHVAVADRTAMHGLIANSHNIVLDLVVWNGLPVALVIVAGLVLWYWQAARRAVRPEQTLLLLALATFCVHAGLELPHVFAYFLVPVAIMAGTLNADKPLGSVRFVVPKAAVGAVLLVFGAVFCELFLEYRRIETQLTDARMRAARIARAPVASDPQAYLLSPLQSWLTTLQLETSAGMPSTDLERLRRIVIRYPTALGLLRYAQASAMNGHPEAAGWAFDVLCSVHAVSECKAAAADWATLTSEGRPELASVKVPVTLAAPSR